MKKMFVLFDSSGIPLPRIWFADSMDEAWGMVAAKDWHFNNGCRMEEVVLAEKNEDET
jgi:hypothetical protein